ncbi:hypothetical protein [Dactylococcopsis salina]|uniref:Uncharacterized protein n=1 Tax=Dactylococcopsis salina (strain PCC 8305) TaxID=13035 RepID=K9YVI3_DACS8|nr:hypothetical protein [Dactylococcopsis salina]AFZ50118.1 hypothetical protein Dacsa_1429 [Dactylococcopsis salina PCC 8305]
MVGIIKNLFSGKDNYYAELSEDQTTETETQQSATESQPEATKTASIPMTNESQPQNDPLRGETFAPNYLMPKATPFRRRPGANLENFKALAREVNIPRN